MDLVVLVALKFLVYCGVVAAAVPLLQLPVEDRRSFTLKWAGLRLAMGLAFGFVIAALYVAVGKSFNSEAVTYLVSFGLVRVVEWSLVLLLLHRLAWPLTPRSTCWRWQLASTTSSSCADIPMKEERPNPSLERTSTGMAPRAVVVHHPSRVAMPAAAAQLKR